MQYYSGAPITTPYYGSGAYFVSTGSSIPRQHQVSLATIGKNEQSIKGKVSSIMRRGSKSAPSSEAPATTTTATTVASVPEFSSTWTYPAQTYYQPSSLTTTPAYPSFPSSTVPMPTQPSFNPVPSPVIPSTCTYSSCFGQPYIPGALPTLPTYQYPSQFNYPSYSYPSYPSQFGYSSSTPYFGSQWATPFFSTVPAPATVSTTEVAKESETTEAPKPAEEKKE
jgi:hypothetical protein